MATINIEYLLSINYSLINNGVAICQFVELCNDKADDLRDIIIECSGDFFQDFRSSIIASLKTGKSIRLQGMGLSLKPTEVALVTEKITSTFTINVYADALSDAKKIVFTHSYDIDIMPYDQWLGTSILPQCLASFVTPNHPAVNNIIAKAASKLKEVSGASAFTAYQTGNSNEVRKQVAAVYGALHAEGIVYRSAPASYEIVGQRITLPDQVLTSKVGNCIELTLLFASVLESIGLNSGIVLQEGHAYLAVWLVDDCCQYSVCDDASYIEKKCSDGIDEMLVLECTQITAESTTFEDAQSLAIKNLANTAIFEMFIDIKRCRLEQVRPLPQRVVNNGVWEVAVEGTSHDECMLNVKEHSRFDLSMLMDNKREITKLDIWERKLLDFSLRNSMLNLYLRQKAIQFISFDIDLVEDYLQDGMEYLISCKPDVSFKINDEERLVRSKSLPELHELITNDIKHRMLHTYQTETDTRNTLKNIYRASKNAIEETGANALYLAIGTLRWYETEISEKSRYAPILMLPVEMVYKKGDYYIRTRDEEITLNITLIEFLRQNFEINIPGLNPLPTDEHGVDVKKIFAIIREVLKNKKRWDVEEECILGVFSFSKFLMWNDIHNHRQELLENNIVCSLVEQKLTFTPSQVISELKDKDKEVKPSDLALPVPVDSSQMAAVMAAGQGHSFILYGPPGTGKSQTITNLIANALFQGKRVLFVAEKMAALNVVQKRLEKINLGPFCLEMHSNKITKRHVLEQLKKAMEATHIQHPKEYARIADELYAQRCKLIEYMEALHDVKGPEGMSLFDSIIRYESIDGPELDLDVNDAAFKQLFRIEKMDKYAHLLSQKYQAVLSITGTPSKHPLLGLTIGDDDLANVGYLSSRLKTASETLRKGDVERHKLLEAEAIKAELLRDCNDEVLSQDGETLYNEWRSIKAKWFLPRFFAKRSFLTKLKQFNNLIIEQDIDTFLSKLLNYQQLHNEIITIQDVIHTYFAVSFDNDKLPTNEDLKCYVLKLDNWLLHTDEARDWYQWCAYKKELEIEGLGIIAQYIENKEISAERLKDAFFKRVFRNFACEKIASSQVLRTFEGTIFDETISRYKKLTEEFQLLSQKELYARLAANVPHVTDSIDNSSPIGFLNRNIANGGRGVSLRDLFDNIDTLLPRLCPCMLMSPMSVAQFLDLSRSKFDLVIFDEASQMPTSEAIGAIARGKSLIVVGDPKQMPPTSFFSSTSVSEDEADIDDLDSILDDYHSLGIPSLQLNWHYRSKHESLIAFSNNEYYDGELITFPSVDDQTTKVKYYYVDGVYDKGGRRSNKKEAETIVEDIVKRLQSKDQTKYSIGVIAFSQVQQNLIDDLLTEKLDKDKKLREAAEALYEPIFVKNLENVQGDERDIILFSIGYGPDKDGRVSMNFGPLNNNGGEKRLNVAVSRARREMNVYSSLKASQIDLKRTKARGVEGLKHFLEYAEQQVLINTSNNHKENSDYIISEQIADALRAHGHIVNTNVGRSNFKVDVAIADAVNNDNYVMGILLDGEVYHNTQTTRDREIVQPTVLNLLGWKIMRVWSVDWINNPERVIARIEKVLQQNGKLEKTFVKNTTFDVTKEKVEKIESNEKDYHTYQGLEDTDAMSDEVLVKKILACEQPMTLMYLCRCICAHRDTTRVTSSLVASVKDIADRLLFVQEIGNSTILWTDKACADSFSGYRQAHGRDITEIPLIEIMNAIILTVREQLSIKTDALTLLVAKRLGFSRRGSKVEQALKEGLEALLSSKSILEADGFVRLPE